MTIEQARQDLLYIYKNYPFPVLIELANWIGTQPHGTGKQSIDDDLIIVRASEIR